MSRAKIVSLGQCGADHPAITRMIRESIGADVVGTDTFEQTLDEVSRGADLVLVNRVLDRTGESGLEFIRDFRAKHAAIPILLVSNYADAQRDAVALGAQLGFGKSALGRHETIATIRAALGGSSSVGEP